MTQRRRFTFAMEVFIGEEFLDQRWIEVGEGGMPHPVLIRVGRSDDGRPTITGMIMGSGQNAEITPGTLRSVRVGAILRELFEGYDPGAPPGFSWDDLDSSLAAQIEWGLMREAVRDATTGPIDDRLREFARVYQRERVRNPRRPMNVTAETMHLSLATAKRWAAKCRELGLLPNQPRPR